MLVLRADPWSPDFGADVEIALEEPLSAEVVVDPLVETSDWSRARKPPRALPTPFTLVDGVRRVDLRVLAEGDGRSAWGLLGSYAVGAVRCDRDARFITASVRRALIVGGGLRPDTLSLASGGAVLEYEGHPSGSSEPLACLQVLQNLMREAEGELACRLAGEGIVLVDGPLHYPIRSEAVAVGLVKRMVRPYLEGEHAALLPLLRPGERTPLFALGRQVLDRYAWYQRLVPLRPPWHPLAALLRCEVRMSVGIERARNAADWVAAVIPAYAGRSGLDPRAPQNLAPVGALEAHLRRRLGHARLIRRALEAHLMNGALQ